MVSFGAVLCCPAHVQEAFAGPDQAGAKWFLQYAQHWNSVALELMTYVRQHDRTAADMSKSAVTANRI